MARSNGVCTRLVRARSSLCRRGVDVVGDATGEGVAGRRRRCGSPRIVVLRDVADGIGVDEEASGGVDTRVGGRRDSSEGDGTAARGAEDAAKTKLIVTN